MPKIKLRTPLTPRADVPVRPVAPAPVVVRPPAARAPRLPPPVVLDAPPEVGRMSSRELVDAIHARSERIKSDFHAIGTMLRALDTPHRVRELGYETFDALLAGEGLGSKMTASRLKTAAILPAEIALPLGMTKSYELVRWARAVKNAKDDAAVVRVVTQTRRIDGTPLEEITTRALARLHGIAAQPARPAPGADRDAARGAANALRRSLRRAGVDAKVLVDERPDGTHEVRIRLAAAAATALATELSDE